jgi:hypothetical protein
MKAFDVLGYAFDADLHCQACTRQRFGRRAFDDRNPPADSEGNPIHPIFAGDEHDPAGEHCGDCGTEIVEPAESDGGDE